MADTLLPVIDARPNRETFIFSKLKPRFGWRLFVRVGVDQFGSSPKIATGYLAPLYPPDLLTAAVALETLAGASAARVGQTLGPVIDGQLFFLPRHGPLTVPAQTIAFRLAIGMHSNSTSGGPYMASIQIELVKISAGGSITQLATVTDSPGFSYSGHTNWVAYIRNINLVISSPQVISGGEQLALRITTTGNHGNNSAAVRHCINSGFTGSDSEPTLAAETHIAMMLE